MFGILLLFIQIIQHLSLSAAEMATQERQLSAVEIKQKLLEGIKFAGYKPKINPLSLKDLAIHTLLKSKTSPQLAQLIIPTELKDAIIREQDAITKRASLDNAIKCIALAKEDDFKQSSLTPLQYVYESHDKNFLVTYWDRKTIIYRLTNDGLEFYKQVSGRFMKYTPDFKFLMVERNGEVGFVKVETNEFTPLPTNIELDNIEYVELTSEGKCRTIRERTPPQDLKEPENLNEFISRLKEWVLELQKTYLKDSYIFEGPFHPQTTRLYNVFNIGLPLSEFIKHNKEDILNHTILGGEFDVFLYKERILEFISDEDLLKLTKNSFSTHRTTITQNHRYLILRGKYSENSYINHHANFLLVDTLKLENNEPCLTIYVGMQLAQVENYTIEICPNGRFCLILTSYENRVSLRSVTLVDLHSGKFVTLIKGFPISYGGFSKDGTCCFVWTKSQGFYVYNLYEISSKTNLASVQTSSHPSPKKSLPETNLPLEYDNCIIKLLTEEKMAMIEDYI